MSDFWEGQLENLQTTAEIFFRLTSKAEGGDKKQPDYKEFRASRLQLRFAQDLVTVIQFFLNKEKEHYERDHTPTLRHGDMGFHVSDILGESAERIALFASENDRKRLQAVIRRLSFGASDSPQ